MKFNFTIRIHKDEYRHPTLTDLQNITISDITIISKPEKYGRICKHNGNKKKFGYDFTLSKSFSYAAGSHSSPILWFKGDYIDIIVKDFPRFPAFTQDKYSIQNALAGTYNGLNNGFPHQLLYRKIEILWNNQK